MPYDFRTRTEDSRSPYGGECDMNPHGHPFDYLSDEEYNAMFPDDQSNYDDDFDSSDPFAGE